MPITINGNGAISGLGDIDGHDLETATLVVSGDTTIAPQAVGRASLFVDDSTNTVGINTTTPDSGVFLEVADATDPVVSLNNTGNGEVRIGCNSAEGYIGTESNHPFVLKTNGNKHLTVTEAGFVGIGTETPSSLLEVQTNYAGSDQITTFSVDPGGQVTITRNHARSPVIATDCNSGRPTITLSNNSGAGTHTVISSEGDPTFFASSFVGIGTSTPDTRLTVDSITTSDQAAKFTGNGIFVNHALGSSIFIGTQNGLDGKIGTQNSQTLSLYSENYANRLDITTNGDAFLRNGNLGFPDGYGINFSASQGSGATSAVLDDYEEGTWTLQARDNFSAGNQGSFASEKGYYTKTGNMVTVWGTFSNVDTTGMNPTFDMCIAGLPFAATNVISFITGACSLGFVSFDGYIVPRIEGARSSFRFTEVEPNSTTDFITVSQFSSSADTSTFTLTYFVN